MNLSFSQIISWLSNAKVMADLPDNITIDRVHTDTRTLQQGDLFVALTGEHFNANHFLQKAKDAGAAAIICETGFAIDGIPCCEVPNTRLALGELAGAWRAQMKIPIIAVTGSNGKTTTTQLIASILNTAYPNGGSLSTQHNHNNEIGVSLTLLRLREHHNAAVIEIGINHIGEMNWLASLVNPTVALINNALREHMEFMKSIEIVARENGTVLKYLSADGVAVFPCDDEFSPLWEQLSNGKRCLRFGIAPTQAEVQCESLAGCPRSWQINVRVLQQDAFRYTLPLPGIHNVKNSLAAIACSVAIGISHTHIQAGIECFEPVKGRLNFHTLTVDGRDITVINDTYNANPDAVEAAIHVLAKQKGPHLLVLGSMGETGEQGPEFHRHAALLAKEVGIKYLFSFGELAKNSSANFLDGRHFESVEDLITAIRTLFPLISVILIKGSRAMQMERVVSGILDIPLAQFSTH